MTILLLTAMTLTLIPLASASTGYITPSPLSVPAGGNITLDMGTPGVTWSGGQFYLLLSADGYSQVSPGDLRYTPSFNVADLVATTTKVVTDPTGTFPGSWTIGNNLVVGSIPSNIAGGAYYIKAFDGAVTSLAVTSSSITVTASISVAPTTGAAGTSLTIKGNAFPANALVNITYLNPITAAYSTINNLTQTGTIGNFSYSFPAPDLKRTTTVPGDQALITDTIQFQVTENKTAAVYTTSYDENTRGLLQFGRPRAGSVAGNLQNSTLGIFGNLTDFTTTVSVGVGDSLRIVGNWFYPGAMTIKWDNSIDVTPTGFAANGTGYFNATVTVPTTGLGTHNVTIVDNGAVVFAVFVNVVQSITINPTTGPIGTTVVVTGYGFPAQGVPAGNVYNVTITFAGTSTVRASTLTNTAGYFNTSFVVPTAAGGSNEVRATANDTAGTYANKTFSVIASFTVTPTSFYANSSNTAVVATGTGIDPANRFFVAIDNVFSPFSNTTNGIAPSSAGELTFTFIGVGYQPGLHVVALYQVGGNNKPVANATFTVLSTPDSMISAINDTVTSIKSDTTTMKANLTTIIGWGPTITNINNGVATIQGTLGTMTQTLSSMQATLSSVSGQVASISTSIGTMTAQLSALDAKVTSIEGKFVTIETSLGTIEGVVQTIDSRTATIWTDVGTLTMDVATLQDSVDSIPGAVNLWVYIAIALAAIAAIASIITLVIVRQKIAA